MRVGTAGGADTVSETRSTGGLRAARREYERRTAAPATKKRRPRGRNPKYARRRRNAGVVLLASALLVVMAVWFWGSADEIRRGARVGEVSVGGMTRDEA